MPKPTLQSGLVKARADHHVLRVTLDRPAKRNALTAAMYADLTRGAEHAANDDDINALLIDAEGDMFCAGNDIADFAADEPTDRAGVLASPALVFIAALRALDKPVVIAVQGQATGIGLTMLLHADLVIAADDARFFAAFIDLGIVPEAASSLLLPALIGRQNAARLLLAGDNVSAAEAERMGLVAYRVERAALPQRAGELAAKLAAKSREAMRHAKQLMRAGAGSDDIDGQLGDESERLAERLASPEVRATFEKFMGRKR